MSLSCGDSVALCGGEVLNPYVQQVLRASQSGDKEEPESPKTVAT